MPDIGRFTKLLFADQSLTDLLAGVAGYDEEGVSRELWMRLKEAERCLREDRKGEGAAVLTELVSAKSIETRVLLWSWRALRQIGVQPNIELASKIQGVVLQVPMPGGADVLAAYDDGTARYLNFTGKVLSWNIPDHSIHGIIRALLVQAQKLDSTAKSRLDAHSAGTPIKVSILTVGGNHEVEIPCDSVGNGSIEQLLSIGAELITRLKNRSEVVSRLIEPPSH